MSQPTDQNTDRNEGRSGKPGTSPSALAVLQNRSDFLRVAGHQVKWVSGSMIVQMAPQPENAPQLDPDAAEAKKGRIRVGYTASKKVGNAVARARAKRRLREVVRETLPPYGREGYDYVLIARTATLNASYDQLIRDFRWCLKRLHQLRGPDTSRKASGKNTAKRRVKPDVTASKGRG